MPIDFRQVAAPSFSDSNTLVALAAKQQEEAMAGIQGAWTGAMDAVGNRVQGEMEGIANQASFSQLTDPTQRAALDQEIMAANTLGMGNVKDINKYVDSRRGVQLGLLDTVNRVDRETQLESERVDEKAINDTSWYMSDVYRQIEAEEDPAKKSMLQQAAQQQIKQSGLTDMQLSKASQLADQQMQKQRNADIEEQVKAFGPSITQAQYEAILQNTDASRVNVALAIAKNANQGKGGALASKRKFADGLELQGAYDNDGNVQYDVLKQSLDNRIARSAQEQERVDPETMSYDQYLIKNSDLMEQKLGSFGRKTDVKGLQAHFKWAEDKGTPYPEREKILITEGFLTGSIKMNLFTDNFFDGILDSNGNTKIAEAIAKTHLPKVETEFNTKRMQAGQDAFDPIIKLLTSEGVPPDQILTNLGITSLDHPQAKYLPENMKKALELLVTNNKEAYMNSTPDGSGVGKTRKQIAEEQAPKINIDAGKLTGNPKTNQQQYNGPLKNADTTTEDLVAVGKANNVGKASPVSKPKTTSSTVNKQMVDAENKRIGKGTIKAGANGQAVWVKGSKPQTLMTVYGDSVKVHDTASLNKYIAINQGPEGAQKVKNGQAYLDGKLKYKLDASRAVPDPKHPLANKVSDNLKHFVPYSKRNADGSAIYPKTQYPSYESQKKRK